jgi:hypothetical protein
MQFSGGEGEEANSICHNDLLLMIWPILIIYIESVTARELRFQAW